MNEQTPCLFPALFDEVDSDTDNFLFGDGLYGILRPIKC